MVSVHKWPYTYLDQITSVIRLTFHQSTKVIDIFSFSHMFFSYFPSLMVECSEPVTTRNSY